jgi:hypothetical protein
LGQQVSVRVALLTRQHCVGFVCSSVSASYSCVKRACEVCVVADLDRDVRARTLWLPSATNKRDIRHGVGMGSHRRPTKGYVSTDRSNNSSWNTHTECRSAARGGAQPAHSWSGRGFLHGGRRTRYALSIVLPVAQQRAMRPCGTHASSVYARVLFD